MKMTTSAIANKALKQLIEEKEYWESKEKASCTYTAAINEEPVVPEYDYSKVAQKMEELDEKIVNLKHAINLANVTNRLQVRDKEYSVDQILVKMAQLYTRKKTLDVMRKQLPKSRVVATGYSARSVAPEYTYVNYDIELVKQEYEKVSQNLMELQMALDRYNQTVEFEADI